MCVRRSKRSEREAMGIAYGNDFLTEKPRSNQAESPKIESPNEPNVIPPSGSDSESNRPSINSERSVDETGTEKKFIKRWTRVIEVIDTQQDEAEDSETEMNKEENDF